MEFPKLRQINFLGKPDTEATLEMLNATHRRIQEIMSTERLTLNQFQELNRMRRITEANWERVQNNFGSSLHRDSIMNTDYMTFDEIQQKMTQAMALGFEKRPCRRPYKRTSGVFFKIAWLFKKVCLYLSKTVIYVKFRTVCNFKPASKQYLPHSTV
jgi:hypothetical protein